MDLDTYTFIASLAVLALIGGLIFIIGCIAGEMRAGNRFDERIEKVRKAERERYDRLRNGQHPDDVESARVWPTAAYRRA